MLVENLVIWPKTIAQDEYAFDNVSLVEVSRGISNISAQFILLDPKAQNYTFGVQNYTVRDVPLYQFCSFLNIFQNASRLLSAEAVTAALEPTAQQRAHM